MDRQLMFRMNMPQVIHEFFEDEAVVINLETGSYFSADKTASDILNLIGHGTTINEIVTALASMYEGQREQIESAVELFIAQLIQESLIIAAADGLNTPTAENYLSPIASPAQSIFKAPVLEKYSDLQELLLLDPIHDVDAQGWPVLKPMVPSEI